MEGRWTKTHISRLYVKVSLSLIVLFSTVGYMFAQITQARVLGYVSMS